VTHVYGEHLGLWQPGVDLLNSLRSLSAFDGGPACAGALARGIATLQYASGDTAALESLTIEDRVHVLASAAAAFAGRSAFRQAISAYTEALRLASSGLPSGSPARRALAGGGTNVAAALEEKKDRDPFETTGMVAAAEGGLRYWKEAGTWLEEERAEYRLARSLLQAGTPKAAIRSAQRCVEVCQANDAPPFEQFFGYAVLALAQRAAGDRDAFDASRTRALQLFEEVPQDERRWCATEVEELGG